ncbi:MAG TPA: hypothetical protein VIR26_00840 [Metalysinibacillus sp.]
MRQSIICISSEQDAHALALYFGQLLNKPDKTIFERHLLLENIYELLTYYYHADLYALLDEAEHLSPQASAAAQNMILIETTLYTTVLVSNLTQNTKLLKNARAVLLAMFDAQVPYAKQHLSPTQYEKLVMPTMLVRQWLGDKTRFTTAEMQHIIGQLIASIDEEFIQGNYYPPAALIEYVSNDFKEQATTSKHALIHQKTRLKHFIECLDDYVEVPTKHEERWHTLKQSLTE